MTGEILIFIGVYTSVFVPLPIVSNKFLPHPQVSPLVYMAKHDCHAEAVTQLY